jgi:glucosamine kinase
MTVCLGVDAGGTSTRAVLLRPDGTCLGYGRAGGGNPVSWGPQAAARSVAAAVSAAVADHRESGVGLGPVTLTGPAVMAMAGGSSATGPETWAAVLAETGVRGEVLAESDLLATFSAGTPDVDGYALVAGTGASAIRISRHRVERVVDGLGWLVGDEGSGFWIGQQAVRAALAALDDRGQATTLSAAVLAALGPSAPARSAGQIPGGSEGDQAGPRGRSEMLAMAVGALYRMRPVELSRFAAAAMTEAENGDAVARAIVSEAEGRLLHTLAAVHRPGHHGPIVLGGGIARRLRSLPGRVAEVAASWGPQPPEVLTVEDGAAGAAVLALRHAGFTVTAAVFDRLIATLATLRTDPV